MSVAGEEEEEEAVVVETTAGEEEATVREMATTVEARLVGMAGICVPCNFIGSKCMHDELLVNERAAYEGTWARDRLGLA